MLLPCAGFLLTPPATLRHLSDTDQSTGIPSSAYIKNAWNATALPLLAGLQQAEPIFNVVFFVVLTSVLLQGGDTLLVLAARKSFDEVETWFAPGNLSKSTGSCRART